MAHSSSILVAILILLYQNCGCDSTGKINLCTPVLVSPNNSVCQKKVDHCCTAERPFFFPAGISQCYTRSADYAVACKTILNGITDGGRCFFIDGGGNWTTSWDRCVSRGGVLAHIHTSHEFNTVLSYLRVFYPLSNFYFLKFQKRFFRRFIQLAEESGLPFV